MNNNLDDATAKELAKFFARRLISRTDVFAVQNSSGGTYRPVRRAISLKDILAHLRGENTFGHYILDADGNTKIFCIDIDFKNEGFIPSTVMPRENDPLEAWQAWDQSFSVRPIRVEGKNSGTGPDSGAWFNRSDPARSYLKYCLRNIVDSFLKISRETLRITSVAAFSGHKGAHVYGLLAYPRPDVQEMVRVTAEHARTSAEIVLTESKLFEKRNKNSVFWDGKKDYPNSSPFTCEVFPKQSDNSNIELGNLIRLPLGKNLKRPIDPTFWIDDAAPEGELVPMSNHVFLDRLK